MSIFDAASFSAAMIAHRQAVGIDQCEAAQQMGLSASTLCRVEGMRSLPDVENMAKMLVWIGATFETFTTAPVIQRESHISEVMTLIRQDTALQPVGRNALIDVVRVIYRHYSGETA